MTRPAMTLAPDYRIRAARPEDLTTLAVIEQAASELFRDTPYSFLAGAEPLPLEWVKQQCDEGQIWVAVDLDDRPVGFAIAYEVDATLYLAEIDVCPADGRRGIGCHLVETVCAWAKQHHYLQVTLSTFCDIAWNALFYEKLGFRILSDTEITPGLQQIRQREGESGLPLDRRVMMCRDLRI